MLEVKVAKGFERNAEAFLEGFRQIRLDNLPDGYKIQIGWSIFTLKNNPDHSKSIFAPDYIHDPIHQVIDDLTLAIQIQEKQFGFLQSFHIEGEATVFYSRIVCAKNVLSADKIYLHRTEKSDKYDSGWYIGYVNAAAPPTPNELESIYAFELLYQKPSLVKFLALPTDWIVIIENDAVTAVVDSDNQNRLQ